MLSVTLTRRGRALTVFIVALTALVALASCSSSSKPKSVPKSSGTRKTKSASAAQSTRTLRIGSTNVQRAGALGTLRPVTKRELLAASQGYLEKAVLVPLETGRLGKGFSAMFDPGIRPAARGPDQGALTDVGVGKTKTLRERATPVKLSVLFDQSGHLLYAATRFKVTIDATKLGAKSGSGGITISRHVELTFGHFGKLWLVLAYRVQVARTTISGAGKNRTTTSAVKA